MMGLQVLVLHLAGRTVLAGVVAVGVARLVAVALPLSLLWLPPPSGRCAAAWPCLPGAACVGAVGGALPATAPHELLVGITRLSGMAYHWAASALAGRERAHRAIAWRAVAGA